MKFGRFLSWSSGYEMHPSPSLCDHWNRRSLNIVVVRLFKEARVCLLDWSSIIKPPMLSVSFNLIPQSIAKIVWKCYFDNMGTFNVSLFTLLHLYEKAFTGDHRQKFLRQIKDQKHFSPLTLPKSLSSM